VEIGRAQGDRVAVRSARSPRVVEVDEASLEALPAGPDDVEEKPPAAGPSGKAEQK